jgi:hypothetical protein
VGRGFLSAGHRLGRRDPLLASRRRGTADRVLRFFEAGRLASQFQLPPSGGEVIMIDNEAKLDAIRQGTTSQPPEVEAIGVVFAEILRPLTLQPFPWPMVDALRAIDAADRRGEDGRSRGNGL